VEIAERKPQERLLRSRQACRKRPDAERKHCKQCHEAERGGDEHGSEQRLARLHDSDGGDDQRCAEAEQDDFERRPLGALDTGAEQTGGRNVARLRERPDRERRRRKQAVEDRSDQRHGIDAEFGRHRERIAREGHDDRGYERARHRAEDDGTERDQPHLDHVDAENRARIRADAFQRCDRARLAVEIGTDTVADADTGDEQRRKTHERQELAEPFDETPCAGRTVRAVLYAPCRIREALIQRLRH
jgi:hypothetical protein